VKLSFHLTVTPPPHSCNNRFLASDRSREIFELRVINLTRA